MGSSYQTFHGRGFWASDVVVSLWYACLFQAVDNAAAQPAWLREEIASWKNEACVDSIGMSLAVPNDGWSQDQVAAVLDLARLALARLGEREWFTPDDLNAWHLEGERVSPGVVWSTPLAADLVLQVGDAFTRLLDGTFSPDPPFAMPFVGTPNGLQWIQRREPGEGELGIDQQVWKRIWGQLRDEHEAAGGSHWQRTPPLTEEPDGESSGA